MNNIYISKATIDNLELLAKLEKKIWENTYKNILPAIYIDNLDILHIRDKFLKRLYDNRIETYIIYKGNDPVGYLVLTQITPQQLEISKIYLLAEYQRQGIGHYCYRTITDIAIKNCNKVIEAWIVKENLPSIAFHKKLGFKHFGISVPLKGLNGYNLIKFVKILSNTDNPIV